MRQGTHEPVTGNTKLNALPLHDGRVAMCIKTGHDDLHARFLDLGFPAIWSDILEPNEIKSGWIFDDPLCGR